jgi:hypothetical protein
VGVAIRAGKDRVVRWIGVALPTSCPLALVCTGINREPRVIEHCSGPPIRVMARLTSSRKSSGNVIRIGCRRKDSLVARIAICRGASVLAANVTISASHIDMSASQRESRPIVIKVGGRPRGGAVAHLARLRKPSCYVVRIRCLREFRKVARRTQGAQSCIPAARMAALAGLAHVRASQREQRLGVIKDSTSPIRVRSRMTQRTVCGESGRRVIRIRCLLISRQVARCAIFRRSGKPSIHVTLITSDRCVQTCQRERRHRVVVERCAGPGGRVVALLTRCRETRRNVVRILGVVEIRLMATYTRARRALVLAIRVALRTCGRLVSACQWERRSRVIKLRSRPRRCRVTRLTRRRKPGRDVVRILGVVEVCLVTAHTVCWRAFVLAVRVALRTSHRLVRARQREPCGRVVEFGSRPCRRRMTGLAGGWKTGCDVIRILRAVEIVLMTTHAIGRRSLELPVDVALRTSHRLVRTRQREPSRRVIKLRSGPRRCCVTRLTGRWESRSYVVRILGIVEVCLVTTNTVCRSSLELAVRMALRTGNGLVCAGEREARRPVIELSPGPHRCCVTRLTGRGESRGYVVRILGIVEVCLVTTNTVRRRSLVPAVLVALITCHGHMRARQREASQCVVVELRALPCRSVVTLLASLRES